MAGKLRILSVSDVEENPDSGAAGTEYQTIRALRSLGHDVDAVWSGELPHRVSHGNLHYLIEQPGAYRDIIAERMMNHDYDVIHVNQSAAYLAARHHQKNRKKSVFVCRSHGFELRAMESLKAWSEKLDVEQRRFPRSIPGYVIDAGVARSCRLAAKYSDGHVVSCSEDRDFLINRFGVSAEQIACIAQAAPDSYLDKPESMNPERMQKLLMVGPVKLWKGVHILAEAWNALTTNKPNLSLTWVCPDEERGEAKALFSEQSKRQTTFIQPLPQEKLKSVYDSHGIFLFPSLFEGFGKAPLEAMSRGLCVVASDTGGMSDIINSGEDGILFETGNSDQLTREVVALVTDYERACYIGTQATEIARHYSWERVALETAGFYEKLIDMEYHHFIRDGKAIT